MAPRLFFVAMLAFVLAACSRGTVSQTRAGDDTGGQQDAFDAGADTGADMQQTDDFSDSGDSMVDADLDGLAGDDGVEGDDSVDGDDGVGGDDGGDSSVDDGSDTVADDGGVDPCDGVVCNTPPDDQCMQGSILRQYQQTGTCNGGDCEYPYSDHPCQYGCENAQCLSCTPQWTDVSECNCTPTACAGCTGSKHQQDGCGNERDLACDLQPTGCSGVCCGSSCCQSSQVCYQGACCSPNCSGKECGDDGCGGTCSPGCDANGCCFDDGSCFSNRLKLISYNIGCSCGLPNTAMLSKVADLIVAEQADVVALLEYRWDRGGDDNPNTILQLLSDRGYPMNGVYEKRFDWDANTELGQIVLSNQPVYDYDYYRFQGGHPNQDIVQSFRYPLGAGMVRVFSVHPQPGQFCSIVDELEQYMDGFSNEMSVLLGDFNALASDPCFGDIRNDFRDCCDESSDTTCRYTIDMTVWDGGIHAPPDLGEAIDFIFVRRGTMSPFPRPWTVVDTRSNHTINQGMAVSDHFPVIAELAFCLPCSNCLGTYSDCNAACQDFSNLGGYCGWPDSHDFGHCCVCQ